MATKREIDFSYCQNTTLSVNAYLKDGGVRIQLMAEHIYEAGVLIRDVFFEGGDVLRCFRGRFRFVLEGLEPIEIGEGESIVVYPDQRVTIEALDKVNLLVYAVFEGDAVADYFSHLGFYNGLHGRTSTQLETFRAVKHRFESDQQTSPGELMLQLDDALVTFGYDFRDNGEALVFDAVRQIRANLTNRIAQLKPLCEQLHVSRAYLHRVFVRAGIGSPSEFIRREQLRLIRKLLRDPLLTIGDVAERTGFLSQTHFADFVKRYTGHTARELRR